MRKKLSRSQYERETARLEQELKELNESLVSYPHPKGTYQHDNLLKRIVTTEVNLKALKFRFEHQ